MSIFSRIIPRPAAPLRKVAVLILLIFVIGFVTLLGVAQWQLMRLHSQLQPLLRSALSNSLGRAVRIDSVRLAGWGQVEIFGVSIARERTFANGVALQVPRSTAAINLISLLLHGGKNPMNDVRRIQLHAPQLHVERASNGLWDFQDVIDRMAAQPITGVMQASFLMDDGQVTYHDARGFGAQPTPMSQQLVDVHAQISAQPTGQYRFAVQADDARRQVGRVAVSGVYSRATGTTNVAVTADRMLVKELTPYLPKNLPITFENGTAAVRLSALFTRLPHPQPGQQLSPAELTADIDLSGVGLRLQELSTPVIAHSGRLRLVHDRQRYPHGSQLELLDVRAEAGSVPVIIAGAISEINLFDLAQAAPKFDVRVMTNTNGAAVRKLFAADAWPQGLAVDGPVSLETRVSGASEDLHIDGVVKAKHANFNDATGDGIEAKFALRPAGDRTGMPTLQATATLDNAEVGHAQLQNMTATFSSATPWRQLDTALVITGDATAGQLALPWLQATGTRSAFSITNTGVTLSALHAQTLGGVVTGALTVPFLGAGHDVADAVRLTGAYRDIDLAQAARALHTESITGRGNGTLSLVLSTDGTLTGATQLTGQGVKVRGYTAPQVRADVGVVNKDGQLDIAVHQAQASTDYGKFTITEGSYRSAGLGTPGQLLLPLHGEKIPMHRFSPEISGLAQLDGIMRGTISAPELSAHVTAGPGALMERKFARGAAEMTVHGNSVRFRNLLFARDGMSISVPGGTEGVDPHQGIIGLQGSVDIHGASLDDVLSVFNQHSPLPVDGGVVGKVDFQMTDHGLVATGSAGIDEPTVQIPQGADAYLLSLDKLTLQFDLDGSAMRIRELRALNGRSTFIATGNAQSPSGAPLRADLTFSGEKAFLEDLPQDLFSIPIPLSGAANIAGTLHGVLNGSGTDPLRVDVTIAAPQVQAAGIPLGVGAADLTFSYRPDDRRFIINTGTLQNPAFRVTTTGAVSLSRETWDDLSVTMDQLELAKLPAVLAQGSDGAVSIALPAGLAGQGRLQLTASGAFAKPQARVQLELDHLALGTQALPDLRGSLQSEQTADGYRLRINDLTASGGAGEGRATVTGFIDPRGPVDMQFRVESLTARAFSAWLGAVPVDGLAQATGAIRGQWQQPDIDATVQIDQPVVAGRPMHKIAGHLSLADGRLALTDGQVWLVADGQALQVQGSIPLRWAGTLQPELAANSPLACTVTIPRQPLAPYRALLPSGVDLQGMVEGNMRLGGTVSAPRLQEGAFALDGSAGVPMKMATLPNRLTDLTARIHVTSGAHGDHVTIDQFSANLDRVVNGRRQSGYQPGWLAVAGSVDIPTAMLMTPQQWTWDTYAQVVRLPLPSEVMLVPQISGFLRLATVQGVPTLNGVVVADHAKIKEPKMDATVRPSWGPFHFNPQLSLVLQVGEGVKLSKSIISLPVRITPLPLPAIPTAPTALAINPHAPGFQYHAELLHPNTAEESPGSWGAVTGSLNDPQLYARFEVDSKKVQFPLNLTGVKHARGHITYTINDGPRVVMGIPDLTAPAQPTTAQQDNMLMPSLR